MFTIRPFEGNDAAYEAVVGVWNAVWPDHHETAEEWKFSDKTRQSKYLFQRLVVEVNDHIVAYGSYGHCEWSHKPGKYFIDMVVNPEHQGRGIGTALYDHMVQILAELDPMVFDSYTSEDQPHAIRFLAERGFQQMMREPCSRLDISTFDGDKFADISGRMQKLGIRIYTVRQLESMDPDWKHKVWDLEREIIQDIPSPDPLTQGSFEKFEQWLEAPSFHPDAFLVAIDDDRYVGLTRMLVSQANNERLSTELTGVVRSHRREGIATALKLRAIEFAKRYGATDIVTDNEENNPMYTLNIKLGFEPRPAWLLFKKVLKERDEERS